MLRWGPAAAWEIHQISHRGVIHVQGGGVVGGLGGSTRLGVGTPAGPGLLRSPQQEGERAKACRNWKWPRPSAACGLNTMSYNERENGVEDPALRPGVRRGRVED